MTSLLAWSGVDSRAISSVYLASDSRISWGINESWDHGRKLFSSAKYPEIVGYCGDVLFPSQVLGQTIDLIDNDVLFSVTDLPETKWRAICTLVKRSFEAYPNRNKVPFDIVYLTREKSGLNSRFHFYKLTWHSKQGWNETGQRLELDHSGIIDMFGTGKKTVEKWNEYWQNTNQKRTSRSVFGAFCDALWSDGDKRSGGAPQLVGLYREGPAQTFGIIYRGERYLLGLPVDAGLNLAEIEWRNSIFERCDFHTLQRLPEAQEHVKPRGLARSKE